jgi:hypothetical protein
MGDVVDVLEHRIADVVSTVDLPLRLAAEIDFFAGRVEPWCDPGAEYTTAIAARSLASLGRRSDALAALSLIDPATAPVDDVAVAAWAASRVGGPIVRSALARLEAVTSDFLDDEVPIGPRQMYVGLLHAAQGDLTRAVDELRAAIGVADSRAPLWGALCRLELGRVLRTAEAVPIGVSSSAPVLTAARTFFGAGGYRSLLGRVDEACATVSAVIEVGSPGRVGFGVQPPTDIRASKGLVALRHLVANQHRVVSAAELAVVVDGGDAARVASLLPAALLPASWESGDDDPDAAIGNATGTIRAVLFDDATRSRMTKLLRRTIAKLSESHRLVAAHLDASVVTGHGCRYRPAGAPVQWAGGLDR